jgi:4-hydroxybenzoate polyprenyltransferase
MIRRARLLVLLARPAVIVILAMFLATGLAQAGHGEDKLLLARALLTVAGFLLFSVACNDLADEAIDRVNLPGQRPLTNGLANRREMVVTGLVAGAVAVAASATLSWQAVAVTVAGLAISSGYSLRPVRLADRGAVASLALPACYVAVPYLLGIFAVRAWVRPDDLTMLSGLYLGFIGRILLKDFRDVRGDALFGKRTFLVRHGRRRTCATSALCWTGGTAIIVAAAHSRTAAFAAAEGVCLTGALILLCALAAQRSARRDEALISAIAITGRGVILLLLAHLSMVAAAWPTVRYDAVIAALTVLAVGPAVSMARRGPVARGLRFTTAVSEILASGTAAGQTSQTGSSRDTVTAWPHKCGGWSGSSASSPSATLPR